MKDWGKTAPWCESNQSASGARQQPAANRRSTKITCDQPPIFGSKKQKPPVRPQHYYDCVGSVTMSEGPEARWTGEQYDDLHFARALYCDGDPRNDGEAGKPFRSDRRDARRRRRSFNRLVPHVRTIRLADSSRGT